MKQQEQVLGYFRAAAEEWQHKAVNAESNYSVITARNNAVLATIDRVGDVRRLLDVGCGTGQLVIEAAKRGLDAEGIDFAPEMIVRCKANMEQEKVEADFECLSFFDMPAAGASYDVISAQGVIEYISSDEMEEFFRRSSSMLRPGGSLVIGSRNRLYNAVSMNLFTAMELQLGTLAPLVREAIALQASSSQKEAFEALSACERIDRQPDSHPNTGIGVNIRYQYSPAELIMRLRRHNFIPATIYPIHFHGLAPNLKEEYPTIHHALAKLMQSVAPSDVRLIPFCSTFVLDVRKAG